MPWCLRKKVLDEVDSNDILGGMKRILLIATLFLTTLACRPVVTVGWGEVLIVGIILGVLIGPLLLRLYHHLRRDD
ncbi:MAG: hypothetical protein MAG431_00507 [Chloroflexi bacterium]|nr:hypothetical protein [Chloroflexota bacterium]